MRSIRLFVLSLALALASTHALGRASDIEVRTLDGHNTPLSAYFEPGKWTMFMMWTTYCGICRAQYPTVSAFHDKHKDSDAKVVGISLDGYAEVDKVRRYIASKPMSFDNTVTEVEAITPAYEKITEDKFTGTPTYLLFDPSGALIAHVPGELTMEDVEQFMADNTP